MELGTDTCTIMGSKIVSLLLCLIIFYSGGNYFNQILLSQTIIYVSLFLKSSELLITWSAECQILKYNQRSEFL